jgi:hypothetical protein
MRIVALAIAAAGMMVASVAHAGPWTPARGHGQVILTGSFYRTEQLFDRDGDRLTFDFDGRFEKREFNPFIEFGLTDRLTLLLNLFMSKQQFSNQFSTLSNTGLGDSEVGLRLRLTRTDVPVLFAVQSVVKLATAEKGGEVALGNRQTDVDVRGVFGGSIGHGSQPPFWSVEAGFRKRTDGPADELKLDATLGVYVQRRIMLMAQLSGTKGLKNADQFDINGNPTLSPDYDLYRLQGSAVFTLAPRLRLQAGGFAHAFGRNTGAGGGGLVSAWVTF